MGGWRPGRAVKVVATSIIALLWSCNTRGPSISREYEEAPGRAVASSSVSEGVEKQTAAPPETAPASRAAETLQPGEAIWLRSGKSRVLQLRNPVKRVSIGDPSLAGIVVLGPRTIMINAKEAPVTPENQPSASGRSVGVVTGRTLTPEPRVGETTLVVWDGGPNPDIHTLFIADFANQQIMLEVTIAELNRTAMEEHGIDFQNLANSFASTYFMGGGIITPQRQVTDPLKNFIPGLANNDAKPVYAFNLPNEGITALIQLLQSDGLATILAQPKLLAMSGQNAVFQVGGEIPIRIATGFSTDVVFKPFGTLVNFVARISEEGDILLTVNPEVSQPDFNSPVEGIPTFRTRRASTSTRLRNGETLIIGGLLQRDRTENVSGVPYLKDIPYAGYVFRHTTYTQTITELMVTVTPRLVHPMADGTQVALPTDRGPLTNEEIRTKPDAAEATRFRVPGLP